MKKFINLVVLLGLILVTFTGCTSNKYGHFVDGPKMNYARSGDFDAIKLKDGRVLVLGFNRVKNDKEARSHIGGLNEEQMKKYLYEYHTKPSEIYDPKTNKFSIVDFGKDFYYDSKGILLKDGRVLLTSVYVPKKGTKAISGLLSMQMAVYNPYTNKIDAIVEKKLLRSHSISILLNDGTVLMTNGVPVLPPKAYGEEYKRGEEKVKQAEVYNPKTNTTKLVGKSKFKRFRPNAIPLDNGMVLIVGDSPEVEIYNPKTEIFETVGRLNIKRLNPRLVKLDNGDVLILGGDNQDSPDYTVGEVQEAEIYNPTNKTFKIIGNMTTKRGNGNSNDFTATKLNNGNVLIVGGWTTKNNSLFDSFNSLKSSELYIPKGSTFIKIANMKRPRLNHKAILLDNGNALILGGAYYFNGVSRNTTLIFKVKK